MRAEHGGCHEDGGCAERGGGEELAPGDARFFDCLVLLTCLCPKRLVPRVKKAWKASRLNSMTCNNVHFTRNATWPASVRNSRAAF